MVRCSPPSGAATYIAARTSRWPRKRAVSSNVLCADSRTSGSLCLSSLLRTCGGMMQWTGLRHMAGSSTLSRVTESARRRRAARVFRRVGDHATTARRADAPSSSVIRARNTPPPDDMAYANESQLAIHKLCTGRESDKLQADVILRAHEL